MKNYDPPLSDGWKNCNPPFFKAQKNHDPPPIICNPPSLIISDRSLMTRKYIQTNKSTEDWSANKIVEFLWSFTVTNLSGTMANTVQH